MSRNLRFIVFVTIILVSCNACYQLAFRKCLWWNCAPERTFSLFELELPPELFPLEVVIDTLSPLSENSGALEAINATNYWNSRESLAIYNISKFGTEQQANRRFDLFLDKFFIDNSGFPLRQHPEITFQSDIAYEYYVACGDIEVNYQIAYRCRLAAQYEEIVIWFNSDIDEVMTIQNYQEIIIFIDQRMESLLDGI